MMVANDIDFQSGECCKCRVIKFPVVSYCADCTKARNKLFKKVVRHIHKATLLDGGYEDFPEQQAAGQVLLAELKAAGMGE